MALNDVKCKECTPRAGENASPLEVGGCPKCEKIAKRTVSNREVEWVIEHADTDNSGTLDHLELLAATSWWYLHVERAEVEAVRGIKSVLPWLFATAIGFACAMFVGLVSVRFSPEVTKAWLLTTVLGLLWKIMIFDPIKALCCGSLIEPLVAVLTCDFSAEALLEVIEDTVETYTEDFTGLAQDEEATRDAAAEFTRRAAIAAGNNAIFATNSQVASKLVRNFRARKIKKTRAELAEDAKQAMEQQAQQKVASNRLYADKIAAKRISHGMDEGTFARRVESENRMLGGKADIRHKIAHANDANHRNSSRLTSEIIEAQHDSQHSIEQQHNAKKKALEQRLEEKRALILERSKQPTRPAEPSPRQVNGMEQFAIDVQRVQLERAERMGLSEARAPEIVVHTPSPTVPPASTRPKKWLKHNASGKIDWFAVDVQTVHEMQHERLAAARARTDGMLRQLSKPPEPPVEATTRPRAPAITPSKTGRHHPT